MVRDSSIGCIKLSRLLPVVDTARCSPSSTAKGVSTVQKKELVSDAKRTPEKLAQASKTSSGSTEHTVRAGDTLSLIPVLWQCTQMAANLQKPIRKL